MTNKLKASETIPTDAQNLTNDKPKNVKSTVLSHQEIAKRIKGGVGGSGAKTEIIINPKHFPTPLHQFNEGKGSMFKTLQERLAEQYGDDEIEIPETDRTKLELSAHKFGVDYEDLEELYTSGGLALVARFLEEEFVLDEESLDNTILYEGTVVPFPKNPNYDEAKTGGGDSGGSSGGRLEYYKVHVLHNPKMKEGIIHRVEAESADEAMDVALERHANAVIGGKSKAQNVLKPKHWRIVSVEIDNQRKQRQKKGYAKVREVKKKGVFGNTIATGDFKTTISNEKLISATRATKRRPTKVARIINSVRATIDDVNTPLSQYSHLNRTGKTRKSGEAGINKRNEE